MKLRSKEEMARYRRDLRARKKAQNVTPSPASSSKRHTKKVTPAKKNVLPARKAAAQDAPTLPTPCAECARLQAELDKERAESARLCERVKALLDKAEQPAPRIAPFLKDKVAAKAQETDADALRKRVIEQKVNRINNFGAGRNIGSVRL
jgi:hypothetical protein